MTRYEELRAVYVEAKAEFDRLESALAVARAKMRVAEREALAEWRSVTDAAKDRIAQKSAHTSTDGQANG
jgi:hypothetical protein